jgi:beta-lactamase class D
VPKRPIKCLCTSAAIAALLLSGITRSAETRFIDERALQGHFGDTLACALILNRDRHSENLLEFNPERCHVPLSPCSTFKIPNALIGLQTGVVSGPEHTKSWDGVNRSREALNRDHTLQTAIESSVVWYFQSVAHDVGEQNMKLWLERLDYGNRDISSGIDHFWLGASLKIDAYGQLELLKRLHHGSLPFSDQAQEQVREMLRHPSKLDGQLHAKTGSCRPAAETGQAGHGWFVGWVDWHHNNTKNPSTTWFVINITGERASGAEARRIALELLSGEAGAG